MMQGKGFSSFVGACNRCSFNFLTNLIKMFLVEAVFTNYKKMYTSLAATDPAAHLLHVSLNGLSNEKLF